MEYQRKEKGVTKMAKRPTQRQRVVDYMRKHGSITRLNSCTELFIFELASRILELEQRGWIFEKSRESVKNIYGETKNFTRYRILKEGTSI